MFSSTYFPANRRDFQVVCYCHYASEDISDSWLRYTIVLALPITRSHLFCVWEDIWYTIYAGIDVVSMAGPSFSDFEWQPEREMESSFGCHWKTTLLLIILLLLFLLLLWVFIARIISRFRVHWIRLRPVPHPGGEPWEVGKVGQCNQDNQCLGMHWLSALVLGCPCRLLLLASNLTKHTPTHNDWDGGGDEDRHPNTLPSLYATLYSPTHPPRWQFLCSF